MAGFVRTQLSGVLYPPIENLCLNLLGGFYILNPQSCMCTSDIVISTTMPIVELNQIDTLD